MNRTVLKDIGVFKTNLLLSFLDSPDICELLLGENYTSDDVDNLVYSQIFPYLYIDETQTEVLPYLCIEVNYIKQSRTMKTLKVTVYAYCHKDCMEYHKDGYLGTRADILSDMVERQLQEPNKYGIGELTLESVNYYFPNNKYYGRQLIFTTSDFKFKEADK